MRKVLMCVCLVLVMAVGAIGQTSAAATPATTLTVIRAGTLIDGNGGSVRKNQLIFIRGERIEKVSDATVAIPSGAKVIDLSGATVLPGLIDAHTHIFLWGENPEKGGYDANILKAGIALRAECIPQTTKCVAKASDKLCPLASGGLWGHAGLAHS